MEKVLTNEAAVNADPGMVAASRFLSLTSNKLLRGRTGLTWQISTCSFMVIWFLSWKSALSVSKLSVTPRLKWRSVHGDD